MITDSITSALVLGFVQGLRPYMELTFVPIMNDNYDYNFHRMTE